MPMLKEVLCIWFSLLSLCQLNTVLSVLFEFFSLYFFLFLFNFTAVRMDVCCGIMEKFRIFRTEKTYAVKAGKWYFEFEAVTAGDMRVGWTRPGCLPDQELGSDEEAFVFDGFKVCVSLSVVIGMIAKFNFVFYSMHCRLNSFVFFSLCFMNLLFSLFEGCGGIWMINVT